ncbi:1-deoxy-D-xylulose-5-phosphate reductoisomerase [Candidatus Aminicenantes bacterium AC-335-K20]|jgi:1-deoxy-D-xylulose-5-phosphate reductoisomerase|nr:1-deoxy-D-xylulose-5-phosphate reductoisomerase [SCandidatus Aminicenantes bacterium Aminicenantia_JdfR_composite]MCP2619156.1 1-deoxy-D-xylulose-5-phosphate reductoisomerase [Candidatus Aminicenantes bacterium AC-335-K20]MCP2621161.1 1-deoxy-D-xylulose-5-phosphate reductoisomerase [Candidatus Aminicenantes bacterium AC-334-E05]
MTVKKRISILGSTGSIGQNVLNVVENFSHQFEIVGLSAGSNIELLMEQIEKFKPKIVSIKEKKMADLIMENFKGVEVGYGEEGLEKVATHPLNDMVVSAIVGIAGLRPTYKAIKAGKNIALANKECLVAGGKIIMNEAKERGVNIIPIDSEHSGVFQCLKKEKKEYVKKIILTASGGPFFKTSIKELQEKKVEEALKHPRWKMGKKTTIDSATLMNKGLELIEAYWLFDVNPSQLDVLIHPQSIVHSLVEFKDGSILAQMSITDMRVPIQYALSYPERLNNSCLFSLNLAEINTLEFYSVDKRKFPSIDFARKALIEGESLPVVLNAVNEVAVQAFLEEKIKFTQIFKIIEYTLDKHKKENIEKIDDIFRIDKWAREQAHKLIKKGL